jgi:hypothetical protein
VSRSSQRSMIFSVMYTVVTPMLNPFIYSLKNKDVIGALRKHLSRAVSCPSFISDFRTKWTLRSIRSTPWIYVSWIFKIWLRFFSLLLP